VGARRDRQVTPAPRRELPEAIEATDFQMEQRSQRRERTMVFSKTNEESQLRFLRWLRCSVCEIRCLDGLAG
jgi:hypothetical protein